MPKCTRCLSALQSPQDQFKSGKWKATCFVCLQKQKARKETRRAENQLGQAEATPQQVLNPLSQLLQSLPSPQPLFASVSDIPSVPFNLWTASSSQPAFSVAPAHPNADPRIYQLPSLSSQFSASQSIPTVPQPSISRGISPPASHLDSERDEDDVSLADFEAAEDRSYDMPTPPPTIDMGREGYLDDAAISEADQTLIRNFYNALDKETMSTCSVCHRRWFHLRVRRDVCELCHTDKLNNRGDPDWIPLYGTANNMDPGAVPANLPDLTDAEGMLIARVHVTMQIRQHRGLQYKYQGHICHFLVNTARTFSRLPLLPSQLDIIVLKPARSEKDDAEAIERQFKKDFKVRRGAVCMWLNHLRLHHPGYRDVEINDYALAQLPEAASVHDQFVEIQYADDPFSEPGAGPNTQADYSSTPAGDLPPHLLSLLRANTSVNSPSASAVSDGDGSDYGSIDLDELEDADEPAYTSAIPDLAPDLTEFETLQQQIRGRDRVSLTLGTIRHTPIDEFTRDVPLLSLAFPTLFPTGAADFALPRQRKVDYLTYVRHLMCYKDGRFAQHSRFRYYAFNVHLRQQTTAKAGFFVNRRTGSEPITAEDIRAAFDAPDGGRPLIDSIVRFGGTIRGSTSFWSNEGKNLDAMVCAPASD
jgi:ATP-dependent DNA helicase PIF1